jgi:hypothetical protein
MSPRIPQTLPTLGAADDARSSRVEAGGLMSYGPNVPMSTRLCVGRNQATSLVEQPTKFDFVINLTTARCSASTCPRRCSHSPTR